MGLLLLVGLGAALPVQAQWRLVQPDSAEGGSAEASATTRTYTYVESDAGDRLTVATRDDGEVYARIEMPRGRLLALAATGCPTYIVDTLPASIFATPYAGAQPVCKVSPRGLEIPLGSIRDDSLDSPPVLHLMNGSELLLRYRLSTPGYRESRFTLRRSKQFLTQTLGGGVKVLDPALLDADASAAVEASADAAAAGAAPGAAAQ
ncbi:MAG: hypothetical protein KDK91_10145 [Gammaproteobacteria bacterium]|nr:hypothetical protein [Gammaproteobacteria bacterium]